MAELIVAGKGELESDAESFDGHDGDGADRRADGEVNKRILLAVQRGDSVYHECCKSDYGNGVQ